MIDIRAAGAGDRELGCIKIDVLSLLPSVSRFPSSPSILSAQAPGSGSLPGPRSNFFYFFWKRFRTGACTDIQCTFAQKCFFLQRQKSVFKSSFRVRGMGPPQGSALACAVSTIDKPKKKKLKSASFVKDCSDHKAFWHTL